MKWKTKIHQKYKHTFPTNLKPSIIFFESLRRFNSKWSAFYIDLYGNISIYSHLFEKMFSYVGIALGGGCCYQFWCVFHNFLGSRTHLSKPRNLHTFQSETCFCTSEQLEFFTLRASPPTRLHAPDVYVPSYVRSVSCKRSYICFLHLYILKIIYIHKYLTNLKESLSLSLYVYIYISLSFYLH